MAFLRGAQRVWHAFVCHQDEGSTESVRLEGGWSFVGSRVALLPVSVKLRFGGREVRLFHVLEMRVIFQEEKGMEQWEARDVH